MDLADVTIEGIQPYVGTTFEVPLEEGKTTTMKLDSALAYEVRQRKSRFQPKRTPFSIYLHGDPSLILPQGMYSLRSEALTLENVFLVPIGRDEEATEYEAIFT
jgi:hypothetical protein